jgi:hypothetical protein
MEGHLAGNLRIIQKHRDIESPDTRNAGFKEGVRDKLQGLKTLPEFLNEKLLIMGKRHYKIRRCEALVFGRDFSGRIFSGRVLRSGDLRMTKGALSQKISDPAANEEAAVFAGGIIRSP